MEPGGDWIGLRGWVGKASQERKHSTYGTMWEAAGTVAVLCWSVIWAALEQLWGDIPSPRAKEKSQRDSKRGKLVFNQIPFLPETLRGLKQTLCAPGPRDSIEPETELCLSVSWRTQTEPCTHQDPGKRSSDPTRDRPRFALECPGVSSRRCG